MVHGEPASTTTSNLAGVPKPAGTKPNFKPVQALWAFSLLGTLTLLWKFPSIGTASAALMAAVGPYQLALQLRSDNSRLDAGRVGIISWIALILILQALASFTEGWWGIGSLTTGVVLLIACAAIGIMLFDPSTFFGVSAKQKHKAKPVPRTEITIEGLRKERAEFDRAIAVLQGLQVFDANDPELVRGWEAKDRERIEQMLRAGDQLTTKSWQHGIAIYNAFVKAVDLGRSKLSFLAKESEAALAPFNIDLTAITVEASPVLEGLSLTVQRKTFVTEKLNYTQGAGSAVGKTLSGNVPWQVALPVMGGMVLWHLMNRSKILRQLKEMQGKLEVNANLARNDLSQFVTLLKTRVVPQLDGLIAVIARLEEDLKALNAEGSADLSSSLTRDRAFQLASALLEGKRWLTVTGGN